MTNFDAIVVGGGHAGIEATRALAAMGHRVALVTLDPVKIGAMSCNPAIGGVAKSHLVYEIDALGGWMGAAADRNGIQARRLNINKGPAVRSTRVQCDKDRYAKTMSEWMSKCAKVTIIRGEGSQLLTADPQQAGSAIRTIRGLRLHDGSEIGSRAVIITAGTFMRGLMFCGDMRQRGGRFGDSAAEFLSESIVRMGHRLKRLKTGTPARLRGRTIHFSELSQQWGDPERRHFSWRREASRLPQLSCYLTFTNERTHEILRANFDRSPLFSGEIQGVGPRYCPSVEDKVRRFADRDRHQIFLEPEGLDGDSIYPNGLSTSLPADVQLEFLRSIRGLERVELIRPGYAVEYDSIDPTELHDSFMSKHCEGLYFAGQVNRTSGYEEAAAQGLWAGMNAGLALRGEDSLRPERSRSYMETLVDDLVTRGTEEPYRLFTSRSEYRLHLREDNAADRMFALGSSLGLLSDEQKHAYDRERAEMGALRQKLLSERIRIDADRVITLFEYLKRPEISWESLAPALSEGANDLALEQVEIEAKYSGYLSRQDDELKALEKMRAWSLAEDLGLDDLPSLSNEVREKVRARAPKTVLELSQISGVTPSAVLAIARQSGRRAASVSRETATGLL